MKVKGNGKAAILSREQLKLLFTEGLRSERDRALFGICLYTGCRVSEALGLHTTDIISGTIIFRKSTTKGKVKTRSMTIPLGLDNILAQYTPKPGVMFPGMRGVSEYLTRSAADKILKEACQRIGLNGVSTHSFRRTALTQMSDAGTPLRHIQEISGHTDLASLQRYLEVSDAQKLHALSAIGF